MEEDGGGADPAAVVWAALPQATPSSIEALAAATVSVRKVTDGVVRSVSDMISRILSSSDPRSPMAHT